MKAIPAQVGGLCAKAYTPLPWEIFYEFARLVCVGFIVTFGPGRGTPSGSIGRGEDQCPKVEAGQKVSRFSESVPDRDASVDDRLPAGSAQYLMKGEPL